MRICYIYREKERKEHSIEAVFDTVADNIDSDIEITKWYKPHSWRETFRQLRLLRKEKFDCYHITGEVYYLWPFLPLQRTVMTVHDIGMYKNNPWTLKRWLFVSLGIALPSLLHKTIVCVSNLTRNDLHDILHIRQSKLCTIVNPLTLNVQKSSHVFNEGCPTIMQIGTGVHKNLDNLIRSVKGISCKLDIVGEPSEELVQMMDDYGINYSISHHISNTELIEHYQNCDMLYFVSRSEGFGLPILEANAVGRPVVTSIEEPTKSVAGDSALFAHPENSDEIRDVIQQIISNRELRHTLVVNGFNNINRFNPKHIAAEYKQLYVKLFNR